LYAAQLLSYMYHVRAELDELRVCVAMNEVHFRLFHA